MKPKRSVTIFKKLFLPLFALMILQSSVYYAVTVHGSVLTALNNNAMDILTERVDHRQNELASRFDASWDNMSFYADALDALYDSHTAATSAPLYADKDSQRAYLEDAADTLFSMLRNCSVNGVFVILNDCADYTPPGEEARSLYGLCIRDNDLNSGYTDREDLLIVRCPTAICTSLRCPLDSYWDALYTFSDAEDGDYFFKPLQAAYDNPGVAEDRLSYFSGPHHYVESDRAVVSYSLPLVADDGQIYGVLGVEFTTEYLGKLLPKDELAAQNMGGYLLVQYTAGTSNYRVVAKSGTLYQRLIGTEDTFTFPAEALSDARFDYTGKQGLQVTGYVSPLTIYSRNSPFDGEVLALVGMVESDHLYAVSREVRDTLIFVTALVLLVGSVGIFLVSHYLARPIRRLAQRVRRMKPEPDVELGHINIEEIDQLVDAIEGLSRKISQAQVRTEFFSRMSHDMRTPMNAIIGFSSKEAVEGCNEQQLREYLGKINGSGTYLLGLINEVLDMTKIDSGRIELQLAPVCLDEVWQASLPMIDELAEQHEVHFVKHFPEDNSFRVMADAQRLGQIAVNLLSNAVKFTPAGGTVTLTVGARRRGNEQLMYTISVKDTGIGMSKEFRQKLYQPFMQEHGNMEGTGLGLSIAHQLVTLMAGEIQCISEQGKGTEFIVSIPFTLSDASANATALPVAQTVYTSDEQLALLHGKRVLLCEDHPLNRQIAGRLLEKQQLLVDFAENGQIGVEKFAASAPYYYDAILMDIRMPVMNGLEATRAIRAMPRLDAVTVPILAMTANAFYEDVSMTADAGMNMHLSKPIEPQKLYQALASFIAKQDANREKSSTEGGT